MKQDFVVFIIRVVIIIIIIITTRISIGAKYKEEILTST